jgi:hypothetical protein
METAVLANYRRAFGQNYPTRSRLEARRLGSPHSAGSPCTRSRALRFHGAVFERRSRRSSESDQMTEYIADELCLRPSCPIANSQEGSWSPNNRKTNACEARTEEAKRAVLPAVAARKP